jgi:hypothetical protein
MPHKFPHNLTIAPRNLTFALRNLIIALAATALLCLTGCSRFYPEPEPAPGVFQLIENRDGRIACWGVMIQLRSLTVKERLVPVDEEMVDVRTGQIRRVARREYLSPDEIQVQDLRTGRDLAGSLVWSVEPSRKRILIRLKPGMGEFIRGSGIRVKIARSAFENPPLSPEPFLEWTLMTDDF